MGTRYKTKQGTRDSLVNARMGRVSCVMLLTPQEGIGISWNWIPLVGISTFLCCVVISDAYLYVT